MRLVAQDFSLTFALLDAARGGRSGNSATLGSRYPPQKQSCCLTIKDSGAIQDGAALALFKQFMRLSLSGVPEASVRKSATRRTSPAEWPLWVQSAEAGVPGELLLTSGDTDAESRALYLDGSWRIELQAPDF